MPVCIAQNYPMKRTSSRERCSLLRKCNSLKLATQEQTMRREFASIKITHVSAYT